MIWGNIYNREPCFFHEIWVFNIVLKTNPKKRKDAANRPIKNMVRSSTSLTEMFNKKTCAATKKGSKRWIWAHFFATRIRIAQMKIAWTFHNHLFQRVNPWLWTSTPQIFQEFFRSGESTQLGSACPTRSPGATRASARRATIAWCDSGTLRCTEKSRCGIWGVDILKRGIWGRESYGIIVI